MNSAVLEIDRDIHRIAAGLPRAPGPIDGPANWKSADYQNSTAWQYRLSAQELGELEEGLAAVNKAGLDIIQIQRGDFPLRGFAKTLLELRQEILNGRGFVLLRGLPVQSVSRRDAAILYWGIGLHLGYPVSQSGRGQLLGHVVNRGAAVAKVLPTESHKGTAPTSRGYDSNKGDSRFHVDAGDIVGLLCLHPAKSGGKSLIVSSTAIHNEIMKRRPDLLEVLYQPFWRDRRDSEVPAGARPYFPIPVFNFHNGRLFAPYSASAIRNAGYGELYPELPVLTTPQREAMELVEGLAEDPEFHLSMVMEAGDCQLLNNHVILHSRTAYEDWPEDERRRHLLRLWLVVPEHHALPHWHYDRYGAGRRGGIYVPGVKEAVSWEP